MNRYGRLHSLTVSLAPMHVVLWRLASLIAERTGVQVEVPSSSPILIDVCTEHLGMQETETRPSHSVRSSLIKFSSQYSFLSYNIWNNCLNLTVMRDMMPNGS